MVNSVLFSVDKNILANVSTFSASFVSYLDKVLKSLFLKNVSNSKKILLNIFSIIEKYNAKSSSFFPSVLIILKFSNIPFKSFNKELIISLFSFSFSFRFSSAFFEPSFRFSSSSFISSISPSFSFSFKKTLSMYFFLMFIKFSKFLQSKSSSCLK